MAIKLTPNVMIVWVANIILKGIAELSDFSFDLDARTAYVQATLVGEAEAIEVWLEDFAVVSDEGAYKFIIHRAQSNRPWLNNLLSRIVGKAWQIPDIPQFAPHIGLVAELLKTASPEQDDN